VADTLGIVQVMAASAVGTGAISRVFIRDASTAGTGMLLLGEATMLVSVLPDQLRRPLLLLPAGLIALALLLLAARVVRTRSWRGGLLVLAAGGVALRVPIDLGAEHYNLLVPLYAVIAVAGIVLLLDDAAGLAAPAHTSARALDAGVVAFVVLAALSVSWSGERAASAEKVALVYGPFLVLYLVVREWLGARPGGAFPANVVKRMGGAFLGVMTVAAAAGVWQWTTESVWQNRKVEVANSFAPNFRTNSIFWDPNIYGRYLVAALLLLGVWLACVRAGRRTTCAAIGGIALLGTGLWFTYSQSSFAALAAASLLLCLLLLPGRWRVGVAVVMLGALLALPLASRELSGRDEESRRTVASRGLALASERPIHGLGVGSFSEAVRVQAAQRGEQRPRQLDSHTTPITILAELGVLGLAAYLLVLVSAGAATVAGAGQRRAAALGHTDGPSPALAWWAGATFVALVAHSMFYAGFFEDPLVWACLALLGATTARNRSPG